MLHICNCNSSLADCLASLTSSDVLVLTEDAVLAIYQPEFNWPQLSQYKIYLLQADCIARGMPIANSSLPLIDFNTLVILCEQHFPIISWR